MESTEGNTQRKEERVNTLVDGFKLLLSKKKFSLPHFVWNGKTPFQLSGNR
jgi:hypothetical protein